jgi:glycosyltransferase involved in cell wall biosynthesis
MTTLGMGGAERLALGIASGMERRGHSVALLVLGPAVAEEWPTTLPLLRLSLRKDPLSLLAGLWKARCWLRTFKPDLLHSHSFHANLFARLLRLGGLRAPVVSTVHNVYEGPWTRMIAYRLTDCLARQTTAVSQAAAERFVRIKAVPAAKMRLLTNGIDTEEFAPDPERRKIARAANHAEAAFIWMSAGRLSEAKDVPNLLRAFAQLRVERPEARLWIAGEGSSDMAVRLRRLSRELGIEEKVSWLGLRRDLPALLDAADGFVLASAWEGMPLVVAEAMAMEKPVVATDVGGVRELLADAGRLVPAHDHEALGRALRDCMAMSVEERTDLGKRARERMVTAFSLDARIDEWEQLYNSLIAERQP